MGNKKYAHLCPMGQEGINRKGLYVQFVLAFENNQLFLIWL